MRTTSQRGPGVRVVTVPTPSTWPCTMWPPRRSLARTARSRLTAAPPVSFASVVRSNVSRMTSTVNVSPSTPVTVRQTPSTAIDAPCTASAATTGPRTVNRPSSASPSTATSSPSSSTIPVNIASRLPVVLRVFAWCRGDAEIGTEPPDVGDVEPDGGIDGGDSGVGERGRAGAEQRGRDVPDNAVDEAGPPERSGQGGAALEQDVALAALVEAVQQLGEVH